MFISHKILGGPRKSIFCIFLDYLSLQFFFFATISGNFQNFGGEGGGHGPPSPSLALPLHMYVCVCTRVLGKCIRMSMLCMHMREKREHTCTFFKNFKPLTLHGFIVVQ